MTDEFMDSGESVGTSSEPTDAPAMSQEEIRARESGWLPENEFFGDKSKWVDAAEFNRRAPLFEKIAAQNKKLKELEDNFKNLAAHQKNLREVEYKKALESLKAAKIEAYNEGNSSKVVELDDSIDALKEQQKQLALEEKQKISEQAAAINAVVLDWKKSNSWYDTDEVRRAYADLVGKKYVNILPPDQVLAKMTEEVRKEFPHKFQQVNPNRAKPSAVEGSSTQTGSSGKSKFIPTEDQKRVAHAFVRSGIYKNTDEYYKELQEIEKSK